MFPSLVVKKQSKQRQLLLLDLAECFGKFVRHYSTKTHAVICSIVTYTLTVASKTETEVIWTETVTVAGTEIVSQIAFRPPPKPPDIAIMSWVHSADVCFEVILLQVPLMSRMLLWRPTSNDKRTVGDGRGGHWLRCQPIFARTRSTIDREGVTSSWISSAVSRLETDAVLTRLSTSRRATFNIRIFAVWYFTMRTFLLWNLLCSCRPTHASCILLHKLSTNDIDFRCPFTLIVIDAVSGNSSSQEEMLRINAAVNNFSFLSRFI